MSRCGGLVGGVVLGGLLGLIFFWPTPGHAQRPLPGAGVALQPDLMGPVPLDPYGPAVTGPFDAAAPQPDDGFAGVQFPGEPQPYRQRYRWQFLPNGLIYKSYLASDAEPRFASKFVHGRDHGWMWDVELGGRVGLARYGTDDETYPEGFQVDVEGAVFPRLDLGANTDRELVAVDFRVGVPWTVRRGPWEGKLAYAHLSSHLGDEYMGMYPEATRINYVRDSVVLGFAVRPHPDLRLYSEAGWAFNADGGAEPWEFQFGVDYSPFWTWGVLGAPFFAVNGHLRQEIDFGGGLTVQTGLQWWGRTRHLFRAGLYYFNGMSNYRQFFTNYEELIGFGLWYDY